MNDKFSFLLSTRFWAIILGSLAIYLESKGYIGEPERNLIATIVAGFTAVKTIDRNTGDASRVTTVSMPEGVKSVTSTKK